MCLCPGLRLTCCKSGKDRTGMSATLEQVSFLSREFDLADSEYQRALDTMRRSVDAGYINLYLWTGPRNKESPNTTI